MMAVIEEELLLRVTRLLLVGKWAPLLGVQLPQMVWEHRMMGAAAAGVGAALLAPYPLHLREYWH